LAKRGPKPQDWDPRIWAVLKENAKGVGLKPACKLVDPGNWSGLHREIYRRKAADTLPTEAPVPRAAKEAAMGTEARHGEYYREHRATLEAARRKLEELGYGHLDDIEIAALETQLRSELENLRKELRGDPFRYDHSRPATEEETDSALAAKVACLDHLEDVVPAIQAMTKSMRHLGLL
jgi:hypothetical protein